MKQIYLAIFIIILFSCTKSARRMVENNNQTIQAIINCSGSKAVLNNKTYVVNTPIKLRSGQTIDGRGAKIFVDYSKLKFTVFEGTGLKNISIENLSIIGDMKLNIGERKIEKYLIKLSNCNVVNINNIKIENSVFTPIHISDSRSVNIKNCHFNKIGLETLNIPEYSYDGIFIGGYNSSSDVTISNCTFKNIGRSTPLENDLPDDGDGIQIQVPNGAKISDITISNCVFDSCTARGIKIQSGHDINLVNNNFNHCKTGIGISMANTVKKINIRNSNFTNCQYAWATNSDTYDVYAENIFFVKNKISDCQAGYRTSGFSKLVDSRIDSNEIQNLKTFFVDGVLENTKITHNKIYNFGLKNDPSLYMAILIADRSSKINVSNNDIKTVSNSHVAIYFQEYVENIIIENNTISLKNRIEGDKYFIHLTKKDNKEILKRNKTIIND